MFRKLSLPAGALLVAALGLFAFAPSASSLVKSTTGGKTYGKWNLPAGSTGGWATGALLNQKGVTVFKMKAKLAESPSTSIKERNGTISGELYNGSPYPWPKFFVNGKWKSSIYGVGSFEATIAMQVSPLGPVALIGKMAGKFKDDPSPKVVGKYEGEWKAQL